jgi:hypothetical protein
MNVSLIGNQVDRSSLSSSEDKALHEAKLVTARFFAERIMPEAGALRRKIESGAQSMMALPVEAF